LAPITISADGELVYQKVKVMSFPISNLFIQYLLTVTSCMPAFSAAYGQVVVLSLASINMIRIVKRVIVPYTLFRQTSAVQ